MARAPAVLNRVRCRACRKRSGTGHARGLKVPGRAELTIIGLPLPGAYTDEVLQEMPGLRGTDIGRLHDAGVIAGADQDPSLHKAQGS